MKKTSIIFGLMLAVAATILINSCATQREMVSQKTGARLWGENCIRCHNIPSPADYNDVDWETISLHMQIRANLTQEESNKIVAFMKTAN